MEALSSPKVWPVRRVTHLDDASSIEAYGGISETTSAVLICSEWEELSSRTDRCSPNQLRDTKLNPSRSANGMSNRNERGEEGQVNICITYIYRASLLLVAILWIRGTSFR
jgi:hypothetical protein